MAALLGVSFDVREGQMLAVIGPNGAGKTSILNCINGFYRPQKGEMIFEVVTFTTFPPIKLRAWALAEPSRILNSSQDSLSWTI